MEEDGTGEGDAASWTIGEDERIERMSRRWHFEYGLAENLLHWKDAANEYIHDFLTDRERKHFLKVPRRDLKHLCRWHSAEPWLLDMLDDAGTYPRLHNKWVVHICPSPECPCWFADADSLILHLIREHRYAWPCLQCKPAEDQNDHQRFAEALRSTVWKPIDAEAAKGVVARLSPHLPAADSLEWPLSDDSARSTLLAQLQQGFQVISDSEQHDCLRALIALASDIILRHLDPSNNMPLPFRTLLRYSTFCIRFMDEESLSCFVELVKDMQDFLKQGASQNTESERDRACDVNWTKDQCLDAVSFSDGSGCFVLDGDKFSQGNKGIGAWIVEAPIFPTIKKAPAEASSILQQAESMGASVSKLLRTVSVQSSLKSAGLTSCFKLWNLGHRPMPLFGTMPSKLVLDSAPCPATVDCTLPSLCCAETVPAKRRKIACDSQMMEQHLELIKFTYKLQVLESRVRGLCAVDLRMYILPLLRSSLRMKLYIFIRRELQVDDADSGHITEGSQEEQSLEIVHTTLEGGSGATTPCSKKSEQSSRSPLDFVSGGSSTDGGTELDCMGIDGEETPGASVGASMDGRPSPVTNADASSVKGRNISATTAMAEPAAIPNSEDAKPELEAEPGPLWSEEFISSLLNDLEVFSDRDSRPKSGGGSKDRGEVLETKDCVIFIRMTITDVVKHCLERSLDGAKNFWEWRTYMTWECWRCFYCNKMFPDEKSHIAHMVSVHQLGLSWDHYHLVSSQVWQGLTQSDEDAKESTSDEDAKERTLSLDDSKTVSYTYRRFLVKMPASRSPCENNENLEHEEPQKRNLFESKVKEIRDELRWLEHLFDRKEKLCHTFSVMVMVDAEIMQHFARLGKLRQDLSRLCFYDCKKDMLPYINFFLQKKNLMDDDGHDGGLWSWAHKRLNGLLHSVRCSFLHSFSVQLESSGKVVISVEDDNSGFSFAYYGLSWKFDGPKPSDEKMRIKGSFMFSGTLWMPDGSSSFDFGREVVLDNCENTCGMLNVRLCIRASFTESLKKNLRQFEDDFRKKVSLSRR